MTDPTPATPDEAVAALRSIFGHAKACRELMPTDGRCNCMDILAAAGWSLSRQQGDTVAARVEDVARRLHRERGPSGQAWEDSPKQDGWRDRARWLLGIGSDGAGDRG